MSLVAEIVRRARILSKARCGKYMQANRDDVERAVFTMAFKGLLDPGEPLAKPKRG